MTKTALANKQIDANERIARENRKIEAIKAQGTLERGRAAQRAVDETAKHNKFNRTMSVVDTSLNAGGKIAGAIAKAVNDPSWYNKLGMISAGATAIPAYYPNGYELDVEPYYQKKMKAPVVMSIGYIDAIGSQPKGAPTDQYPINTIMARVKSYARELNSRIGEYDIGDLAQVLMGGVELYTILAFAKRLVGIAQYYSEDRIDVGNTLIESLGVNAPLFRAELAEFKQAINDVIDDVNQNIHIPNGWDYLTRKLWLNSVVFSDSNVGTSQLYVFKKMFYGKYDEANGVLAFANNGMGGLFIDVDTFRNKMAALKRDLVVSSEVSTLWSDIRAAYKDLYKMEFMPLDYKIQITYVDEPLMQIQNLKLPPLVTVYKISSGTYYGFDVTQTSQSVIDTTVDIKQDSDGLLYQGYDASHPGVCFGRGNQAIISDVCLPSTGRAGPYTDPMLTFDHDIVGADDLFVSTRLHPVFRNTGWIRGTIGASTFTDQYVVAAEYCGTEIPDHILCSMALSIDELGLMNSERNIHTDQYYVSMDPGSGPLASDTNLRVTDWEYKEAFINQQAFVKAFHSYPLQQEIGGKSTIIIDGTANSLVLGAHTTRYMGDMDKLVPIPAKNVNNLHLAATKSICWIGQTITKDSKGAGDHAGQFRRNRR